MATSEETGQRGNLPPYISFKTFTGFVEKIKETTVPGRVDGSVLRNYAGSVARQLVLTLKYLKLIEQNGAPTEKLRKLTAAFGTPEWKSEISDLVHEVYSPVVKNVDLDNGTYQQLAEAFRAAGADGVVLERAVTFYLTGLKEAGNTFSPHFANRPRKPKTEKTRKKKVEENDKIEDSEEEILDLAGTARFNLPIPGKTDAKIVLPVDVSTDDWEMINTMMKAYVARLEKS